MRGFRGTNMFNTYTAVGDGPETWRPDFQYSGMQFLQVTGLPEGYPVATDLTTGLRLQGDAPPSGTVTTSDERINRIHRMAQYSFYSNMMTIFTDCPGREKQSHPADYTMVLGRSSATSTSRPTCAATCATSRRVSRWPTRSCGATSP